MAGLAIKANRWATGSGDVTGRHYKGKYRSGEDFAPPCSSKASMDTFHPSETAHAQPIDLSIDPILQIAKIGKVRSVYMPTRGAFPLLPQGGAVLRELWRNLRNERYRLHVSITSGSDRQFR